MEFANRRRGLQKKMEYLDQKRVLATNRPASSP